MADPICRWRNSSIKQVLEFNSLIPLSIMNKSDARELVENRWKVLGGSNFFTTPYQLAVQMGMYYEDNDCLYPKFIKTLSIEQAQEYMCIWGRNYYAPNPYTPSLDKTKKPIIINNFLVNWCLENDNAKFSEALNVMFEESIGNTDILVNMLNNFSDVSIDGDILTLKQGAPMTPYSVVYLDVDKNDRKYFFEFVTASLDGDYLYKSFNGMLRKSLQQIFYGAPGTGKSHTVNEQTEGESVIRTTFHPDSDYSTFVGAYKPTMELLPICDEKGQPMTIGSAVLHKEQITYKFVEQAFLQAYVRAWKFFEADPENPKKQYLIIEEINRGNCAQIFGDLFQLLDRNEDGFSSYDIKPDSDIQSYLSEQQLNVSDVYDSTGEIDISEEINKGELMSLPPNLYIWATMNTSDQSLFPIDSAFKRRWDWEYVPIEKGIDKATGKEFDWKIEASGHKYDWWEFLEAINKVIYDTTKSEDKQLGFFFCKANADGIIEEKKFINKVIFYLWNDVFKDYGFKNEIFKDKDDNDKLTFTKFFKPDSSKKVEMFLRNLGITDVDSKNQQDSIKTTSASDENTD